MMDAKSRGSILPPHSTRPTFLPAKRAGYLSSAASPAAPAPSTRVFSISSSMTMACSMSPSSTSSMSVTNALMMPVAITPGVPTAIPSAMVLLPCGCWVPLMALTMLGNRLVCTPTMSIDGLIAFAATAIPAIKPPPPTAITSVSSSGTACSISRAMVPCPATMASSS